MRWPTTISRRDGRWFIMALFNEQRQLRPFLSGDRPGGSGGRPAVRHERGSQAECPGTGALNSDEVFADADLAEWRTILDSVGVTFGIVGKTDEALDDPQMHAIGALVPFADGKELTV